MRALVTTCALVAVCSGLGAEANSTVEQSSDLDAIPKSVFKAQPATETRTQGAHADRRIFLESALTGWEKQDDPLVPAPNDQPRYQERLSLDTSYEWKATDALSFHLSDRLNTFASNTIGLRSSGSLRNDLREAFLSNEIAPQSYLEIGRINLKNGPALGYNPTDYLKPRTQVSLTSIDPSASRENRLGVLMMRGQKLFDGGACTVAVAPGVQHVTPLLTDAPAPLDPMLGQTNFSPRYLASLSYDFAGLSPQVLVFHDHVGTHLGASLSRVASNNVVLYAEWSGVESDSLGSRAITFGKATGSLPPNAPMVPQAFTGRRFQNDIAVGGSWTSSYRMTLNLEFHFHQSGFKRDDFDRWIALGRSDARLAKELWFVRTYAADQGEPLMRQQVFVRLDWRDAFIQYLNLGLVGFVNPFDRSALAQFSAQYALSKRWSLGIYTTVALGGANTEKGSIPWSRNAVLQIVRYF